MKKEVIVFDKDGTLMDFDAFWVGVSVKAIEDVLKAIGREDVDMVKSLQSLGIENGVTDIDGVVCCGTYEEAGLAFYEVLKEYDVPNPAEEIVDMLTKAYQRNSAAGSVVPTCENIKEILESLKQEGRTLLVASADKQEITCRCLEIMGIRDYFDAVFGDDGIRPPKPDPTCLLEYLQSVGKTVEQTVMIGDTMTDVRYAQNAGMQLIGVGKSEKSRERLKPYVDYIMKDISTVREAIGKLEE